MRLVLLAVAVVLGSADALSARAQATASGATTTPLPPTWTEAPQPTAPGAIAVPMNNLNAQGFYTEGPIPQPTPGSIVVHLNGEVVFYGYVGGGNADTVGGRKVQPYGTLGYFRFYPGVDAMTASGLRYGAGVEIRVGSSASIATPTSGGANTATSGSFNTPAGVPSDYTPGTQLYVRRAFGYLGGTWGAVHVGQDDGPISLLDAGVTTFQTYNDGGWNDDLNFPIGPLTPNMPVFPFLSSIGNEYATSKVVYLSPQIFGFDFGVSFEPDDNPLNPIWPQAQIAFSPQLSAGVLPGEVERRRDTVEVAARYQGNLGPTGLYATLGWVKSGVVASNLPGFHFDGLNAVQGGIALSYAGFELGGAILYGDMNNQMALKPTGAKNMFAWLAGTQYNIGPLVLGASYMDVISAGAINGFTGAPLGSERREGGVNLGGTYTIAPGLLAWLSATHGQRYQGGFDFNTGTLGPANNNVQITAVAIGGAIRW